ncbi:hypothetical protein NS184_02700 [Curtobacterium luteum]|uniref:Uncharacterized protein n=1 Tax=Curtobacterium luteum TaxID=33881 RepID=A0A175S099_9MICO|nr:hypothetical protein NS184_02700 [Curtobacterium luteum]
MVLPRLLWGDSSEGRIRYAVRQVIRVPGHATSAARVGSEFRGFGGPTDIIAETLAWLAENASRQDA